jgi:hypothetical protein
MDRYLPKRLEPLELAESFREPTPIIRKDDLHGDSGSSRE